MSLIVDYAEHMSSWYSLQNFIADLYTVSMVLFG